MGRPPVENKLRFHAYISGNEAEYFEKTRKKLGMERSEFLSHIIRFHKNVAAFVDKKES